MAIRNNMIGNYSIAWQPTEYIYQTRPQHRITDRIRLARRLGALACRYREMCSLGGSTNSLLLRLHSTFQTLQSTQGTLGLHKYRETNAVTF